MVAKELEITIDRRPFLLRPDCPPEGQPRRLFDGETETELNPGMQERARGAGLVMRRPQWSPNTLYVHEATLYAKEQGLDDRFHHIVAASYWEKSADLGSLEVVRGLAETSGLDWSALGPRLESGQLPRRGGGVQRDGPGQRHRRHAHLPHRRVAQVRGPRR